MIASIRIGAVLIIVLISTSSLYSQTTVWLSDSATLSDLDITTAAPPGSIGSFDIWIRTEQTYRLNGFDLALVTTGEAIEFTGAEILIGENRFRLQGEPVLADNRAMITGLWVYSGIGGLDLGTGIGPGVPVDDMTLSAYRFATVHYRIAGLGISEIQLKVGNFGLGNAEPTIFLGIDDPPSDAHMPEATDPVIDGLISVVPETNSLFQLIFSVSVLSLRRRMRPQSAPQ